MSVCLYSKRVMSLGNYDIRTYWQWIVEIVNETSDFPEEGYRQKMNVLMNKGGEFVLNNTDVRF